MKARVAVTAALILTSACSGGGSIVQTSLERHAAASRVAPRLTELAGTALPQHLYAVSSTPSALNIYAYALPLTKTPTLTATVEVATKYGFPCSLATDSSNLYVACNAESGSGSYSMAVYPLPLKSNEKPAVDDTSFQSTYIAVHGQLLYATNNEQGTLSAYSLPYVSGESPSATVAFAPGNSPDFITVGSQYANVWVAVNGTPYFESFALPLVSGETPSGELKAAHAPAVMNMTQNADNFYVSEEYGAESAAIALFNPPFTSSAVPSLYPLKYHVGPSLAANAHYLYIGSGAPNTTAIRSYSLPLSSTNRFTTATLQSQPTAMTVGP